MGAYAQELRHAMEYLARHDKTIFMGQAVAVPGTAMTNSLVNVPAERRIELPVAEEMQMGMAIGMSLAGYVPVTFYPRWNFLLLAVNQLVNHLDKLPIMSQGGYLPKVIIRTSVGSERPLHPQCQHVGDFSVAFHFLLRTVEIIPLETPEQIFPAYRHAFERNDGRSTLLVEWGDLHNDK